MAEMLEDRDLKVFLRVKVLVGATEIYQSSSSVGEEEPNQIIYTNNSGVTQTVFVFIGMRNISTTSSVTIARDDGYFRSIFVLDKFFLDELWERMIL